MHKLKKFWISKKVDFIMKATNFPQNAHVTGAQAIRLQGIVKHGFYTSHGSLKLNNTTSEFCIMCSSWWKSAWIQSNGDGIEEAFIITLKSSTTGMILRLITCNATVAVRITNQNCYVRNFASNVKDLTLTIFCSIRRRRPLPAAAEAIVGINLCNILQCYAILLIAFCPLIIII